MIVSEIIAGVASPLFKLIDKIIPDKEAAAAAKLAVMQEENQHELQTFQASMSAILAEANSQDPWTSRARPSFMYVFYFLIVMLIIVSPTIGVFFPEHMEKFFVNVDKGFKAIPEAMWWTFSAGYLGYATNRSWEKNVAIKNK